MSSTSLGAAAVGLLLLATTGVAASPPGAVSASLALRWSDPSALSPTTEQDFAAQLAARLGRPAFATGSDESTFSVVWLGTPERCRVSLSLEDAGGARGTRVLESPRGDCPSLVPALLTVSALLVESYESARTPQADRPEPAPRVAPATAGPPPTARQSPAALEPRVLVSLGGAVSSGLVPKLEMGPAAAVAWAPMPIVRLGIVGSAFIGHDYGEGPGLSLSHRRASLFGCGVPLRGRLSLGLCGNVGLHHYHASGTSLPRPDTHRLVRWSFGVEARAEWQLTRRLWWVSHAGADVTTQPLYFYYTTASGTSQNLFEQTRLTPFLLIALSLELP